MPRQFEKINDQQLASLVHDALTWDNTGILPDGSLRIEADRYRESIPTMDVAAARKICREFALREAAIRWMETQGFKI